MPGTETHITLTLREDVAADLAEQGDLSRTALEGLALEDYRTGKLSSAQVRRMLGFRTRLQVHEFLKQHQLPLHYDQADLEQDRTVFAD